MTQRKIQSIQLSDSGVVPGPYTSANITIDASGRITAATNGSSGSAAPLNEIVYGTGPGVTSSQNLIFNETTGAFTVNTISTTVNPGDVEIYAATPNGTGALNGGNMYLYAGNAAGGTGGEVIIRSGENNVSLSSRSEILLTTSLINRPSDVYIKAGRDESPTGPRGGNITITCGNSTFNEGGEINISAGNGAIAGGAMSIIAGAGGAISGASGGLMFVGGGSTSSPVDFGGDVLIRPGRNNANLIQSGRIELQTYNGALRIEPTGEWIVDNVAGNVGDVLTSNGSGPGSTPRWLPPAGGAPTLPNTRVAYGSPTNAITSIADFTYNDATGTLAVGPTGSPALVEANVGQSIIISGDAGAEFKSGVNTLGINSSGAVLVNASAGTTGQMLTSTGSGTPAVWSTPVGAPPTFAARLLGTGTSSMNRSMYSTWTAVVIQTSTEASWLSYPSHLSLEANGFWRITVVGYADPGPAGSWPDDSTVYGTYVSAALPYNQTSQYARSAVNGNPTSWSYLSVDAQKASWTDEFIVEVTAQPLAFPLALFAENYSGGATTVQYHAMVTAQRIA